MPTIDGPRVVADLKRLAEFGRYKTGVHRPTYSPVDVESRQWLAEKFREAGLDPVIDGIGNVIGHNPSAARRLLVGSHSETQPYGGWLDGSLGVIYALELARAFAADPGCAGLGIEVAAWADEEGHYGNMLGSRSFTDALPEDEIDRIRGRDDGTPLREALRRAGFAGRPRERVDPRHYVGYLEAHIEQGDTLDTTGLRIGVVETIVGIWNYRVSVIGEQNHAGTTRMVRRKDAGVAMVRLASRIHDRFPEIAGPRTVWTIGRMLIEPNAPSVIPGHAEMQVQFRDADPERLALFEKTLQELVGEARRGGPLPCGDRADRAQRAQANGSGLSGADRSGGPTAGTGDAYAAAECGGPRRGGAVVPHAGRHDVHPEPRRHQPSLVGGQQGGGHRARRPSLRRRRRAHPARHVSQLF